jgi:hypothetical protein
MFHGARTATSVVAALLIAAASFATQRPSKGNCLADENAKLVIYKAFVEGELDVPKHLARRVHDLYFNPTVEEFTARTTWSLSNAFTSAFKELDLIPQFKAPRRNWRRPHTFSRIAAYLPCQTCGSQFEVLSASDEAGLPFSAKPSTRRLNRGIGRNERSRWWIQHWPLAG